MLTNPPPVAEAVFTRWTAFKPMMFSSEKAAKEFARKVRKTGVPNNPSEEIFQLRFQKSPSAHFFRRLASFEEATTFSAPRLPPFEGHFGSMWWSLQPRTYTFIRHELRRTVPADDNICYSSERVASELLRFAMFEVEESTLQWNMEQPTTFTAFTEQGVPVQGRVTLSESRAVQAISYRIADGEEKRVDLSYSRELPFGFPSELRITTKPAGSSVGALYSSFQVRQIAFATNELPLAVFSPEAYLRPEDLIVELDMQGRAFLLSGTNRVEMQNWSNMQGAWLGSRLGKPLFWGIAALVLFSVWRRVRRTRASSGNAS